MKLLIDMNLSPRWVEWLASNGISSVHWSRVGPPTAPDTEIMAYAVEHGYVVLTLNLDFGAILAKTHVSRPSVLQLRPTNACPEVLGPTVLNVVDQLAAYLHDRALVVIKSNRSRVRLLPLRIVGPG